MSDLMRGLILLHIFTTSVHLVIRAQPTYPMPWNLANWLSKLPTFAEILVTRYVLEVVSPRPKSLL